MSNRFPADDEHLHKYPGNLKHHKVDPVLSEAQIEWRLMCSVNGIILDDESFKAGVHFAMQEYEAARAKDAERIEQLEALCRAIGNGLDEMMRPANRECNGAHCTGCWKDINGQLVKLLFAAGFKPSDQ